MIVRIKSVAGCRFRNLLNRHHEQIHSEQNTNGSGSLTLRDNKLNRQTKTQNLNRELNRTITGQSATVGQFSTYKTLDRN